MGCIRRLNEYFTEREPWKLKGTEHEELRRAIVRTALEGLYMAAHLIEPFIPNTAASIFRKLGTERTTLCELKSTYNNLEPGTQVVVGEILFTKIELE